MVTRSRAALQASPADDIDIRPEYSISNVSRRSRISRAYSRGSMVSGATNKSKAQLNADVAVLEAKLKTMKKIAALERERVNLDLAVEQIEIEGAINVAKAERQLMDTVEADLQEDEDGGTNDAVEVVSSHAASVFKSKTVSRCQGDGDNPLLVGTVVCTHGSTGPVSQVEEEQGLQDAHPCVYSKELKKEGTTPKPPVVTKSLEAIFQQQMLMMGAMQAPRVDLPEFDGDPMSYHAFMRAFDENVVKLLPDDGARLARLQQLCKGDAARAIKGCVLMKAEEGYKTALMELQKRFGNRHTISELWVQRLCNGNQHANLQEYADELTECYQSLKALGGLKEIESQGNLLSLITRLPVYLQNKWQDKVYEMQEKEDRRPTLQDVVAFVTRAAAVAADPVYGTSSLRGRKAERSSQRVVYATSADIYCPLCDQSEQNEHDLHECPQFLNMTPDERMNVVLKKQMCFTCLAPGHVAKRCMNPSKCKRCGKQHASILHEAKWEKLKRSGKDKQSQQLPTSTENNEERDVPNGTGNYIDSTYHIRGNKVALPLIPVKVTSPESQITVETYALLDTGSNVTLCHDKLMSMLNAHGRQEKMTLTTLEKEKSEATVTVLSLQVSSHDGEQCISIPQVFSRPKLNLSSDNLVTELEVQRWPHLRDLPLHHAEIEDVTLLIGQDCPEALIPVATIPGSKGEPYAVKTLLGWTVSGPISKRAVPQMPASYYISNADPLQERVDRFWALESSGIYDEERGMSVDDGKVLALWQEKIKFETGHYTLPIPFRNPHPGLPDNRDMAERRLASLSRKLIKFPELHEKYVDGMEELLIQGFAVPVPEHEMSRSDGKVWYLPHHPVINPNKDKIRIVFDCAAEHQKISLNSQVRQGPDLTNKLVGVLSRFRLHPVALMADIKSMFHQVRVTEDDQDVLRFLWWPDGNLKNPPACYRMTVHLFGGTWSPSCCNYALRRTVQDHSGSYTPAVRETVERNFYVDDCLKSVRTVSEAIYLAEQVKKLAAEGGFNLTKWTSNHPDVLKTIPVADRSKKAQVCDLETPKEDRALGVNWHVHDDKLGYHVKKMEKPLTRRGILSMLSSVYDPLGIASPFVLKARKIVQDLCQAKTSWDELIPEEQRLRWEEWTQGLEEVTGLCVPRCIQPTSSNEMELHHFSDASQIAYGVASYLRVTDVEGNVYCNLLMAKSRLAPLKKVTIPRLELQAATLATRQDALLRKELDINLRPSTFWTDSTIVLQYIANTEARYHTFVANRVAEIQGRTEVVAWRHVPTNENPADDASRGAPASKLTESRWLHGPDFLCLSHEKWPSTPTLGALDRNDVEVKASVFVTEKEPEHDPLDELVSSISNWMRLLRILACFLIIPEVLRRKMKFPEHLEAEHLEQAEHLLIKHIQHLHYRKEADAVMKGRPVPASSPLRRLRPMMCEGVLVVPGRLKLATLPANVKMPAIMPSSHPVVEILVRYVHEKTAHSGRGYVLNEIRKKYWIIGASSLVRKVIKCCVTCRRRDAQPCQQQEADLPLDRVTPQAPAFTSVGVDYFGPFSVKRGRGQDKRYGCLFTCLATRAIHIEVAESLETDSFLNCLHRFMARRGEPRLIRSDNGRNFVGAERELKRELQAWNKEQIQDTMNQCGIRWLFNPPAASHMGGVWERQIRTVRRVLSTLMTEQVPTGEMLTTLLVIAEGIVNNRPLTPASDDPDDLEPLTPNHLLIHRPSRTPPGLFNESDLHSRKKWRQVQYLADIFWKRWSREYLLGLRQRTKWHGQKRNVKKGDLVMLLEHPLPRSEWPLGRIVETKAGVDGLVRSALIKLRSTELERPIAKLCVLEEASS